MTVVPHQPFDAADYLTTNERVAAYLETYLEDGTPEELRAAVCTVVRTLQSRIETS